MEVSVAEAAVADRKRREVEVAEAAAVAERKKIAATRRDIDERRRIEVAQLALLARASDYRAVLDLRLVGDSFAIGPNGLTEEDRAAKAKGWSRPLMVMARSRAQELERIRALPRDRERAAELKTADLAARGAQLVLDQATHDARVAAHQRVIAHLDQRRAALNADEARLVASATAAVAAREAAAGTQASADAILQDHRRWAEVVDVLEAQPRWVEVGAKPPKRPTWSQRIYRDHRRRGPGWLPGIEPVSVEGVQFALHVVHDHGYYRRQGLRPARMDKSDVRVKRCPTATSSSSNTWRRSVQDPLPLTGPYRPARARNTRTAAMN